MSTTTLALEKRRSLSLIRLADYAELAKAKIALLELTTVATAALLAGLNGAALLQVMLGTACVAASASMLNQWWERDLDRLMPRTADRPLPAGRLPAGEVLLVACVLGVFGVVYLCLMVNALTALLGAASWMLYALVYTPLKVRSTTNTTVGALAGAMPVLMGWAAMEVPMNLVTAALFLLVFLWQFPHFMAIAWIYRKDYARAGMQMLPVVEPGGWRAGSQAVMAALCLLPISLVPAVAPFTGNWLPGSAYWYFGGTLLLGLGQVLCALLFLLSREEQTARRLLRASLIYLPAQLLLLVCLHLSLAG